MELRQLRYFVTVAEELHFGRAAERLLIGQPAVSQQIRRLERELKVELFDRTPRLVRLTPAGDAFLPAARGVLAAEDAARAVAADLAAGRVGSFRLGTITGLGQRLDRILDAFERQAPGLRVELVALPVKERLAQLADGRLDAAFVRGAARPDTPDIRQLPLWQDELMAAVPARHPLATQAELALSELATLPLRLTERRNNPALVDLVLNACQAEGFEPIPGPTSGNLQDTLAAIGTGTPMWTVVYGGNARIMRVPRVAFVPFRSPGLRLPVALTLRQGPSTPGLDLLRSACVPAEPAPTSGDQDS
ncbi:LysR substrate-binding domain-containing protein [Kitasatospora sp. NBC_01287]|uniref:LysR substrate-binding domain-containing protein n=1 Tax=Kitasatospora sp. NBC_01287 TaxID=2903573 RepID=UPI002250ABA8|nr:LysR substrate-binding domain-containing protein [Kitasatospora sp. NBC_01287]MCX4748213.1 LysR substrate-binding domain-containing protein [Kitasatospora sp. NBC_01287]